MKINNHSQQPEVIACQGEEEMFKSCCSDTTTVDKVGNLSRNSSADILNSHKNSGEGK